MEDKIRLAEIFRLRFKEHLKLREIALVFGVSGERIKQIISKHRSNGRSFVPLHSIKSSNCKNCGRNFSLYCITVPNYCGRKCKILAAQKRKPRCFICKNGARLILHKRLMTKVGIEIRHYMCTSCNTKRHQNWAKKENSKRLIRNTSKKARIRAKREGKERARSLLNRSLKLGKIHKPTLCVICKQPKKLDAHHEDYSKPLDVIWMCRYCHIGAHKPRLTVSV